MLFTVGTWEWVVASELGVADGRGCSMLRLSFVYNAYVAPLSPLLFIGSRESPVVVVERPVADSDGWVKAFKAACQAPSNETHTRLVCRSCALVGDIFVACCIVLRYIRWNQLVSRQRVPRFVVVCHRRMYMNNGNMCRWLMDCSSDGDNEDCVCGPTCCASCCLAISTHRSCLPIYESSALHVCSRFSAEVGDRSNPNMSMFHIATAGERPGSTSNSNNTYFLLHVYATPNLALRSETRATHGTDARGTVKTRPPVSVFQKTSRVLVLPTYVRESERWWHGNLLVRVGVQAKRLLRCCCYTKAKVGHGKCSGESVS